VGDWHDFFQAVIHGDDSPDLQERITVAQQAIEERMRQLIRENLRAKLEEEQICEALQTLRLLRLKLAEGKRKAG
jgi:hypothetical protein